MHKSLPRKYHFEVRYVVWPVSRSFRSQGFSSKSFWHDLRLQITEGTLFRTENNFDYNMNESYTRMNRVLCCFLCFVDKVHALWSAQRWNSGDSASGFVCVKNKNESRCDQQQPLFVGFRFLLNLASPLSHESQRLWLEKPGLWPHPFAPIVGKAREERARGEERLSEERPFEENQLNTATLFLLLSYFIASSFIMGCDVVPRIQLLLASRDGPKASSYSFVGITSADRRAILWYSH